MKLSPLVLAAFLCITSYAVAHAEDWPQWRGPNRDGVWRETGIVATPPRDEEGRVPRMWTAKISAGYSGPTVAGGRVFVSDRVTTPEQMERVLCFNQANGEMLWMHEYPCEYTISYTAGPRANVTVDVEAGGERAYSLGAMGHLFCLETASGDVLWQRDLNREYEISSDGRGEDRMPIWGIACAPIIFEKYLIVIVGGREGAGVVAFDKTTGKEAWKSLEDRAQYSAPILIEQAGQPVVVCWTADSVAGLDPASGKVHWREEFTPSRMPIGCATPIVSKDRLFVTSFYDGAMMLKLHQDSARVSRLWRKAGRDERRTEALHSIISTPLFLGDHIYGVDSYGELRCLNAAGERIWENLTATPKARWSTIHFVKQGDTDRTWLFNERGELILAKLSPKGYEELGRGLLIDPTSEQLNERGGVCWAHPAFANRRVFARSDTELVCASLAE